MFLCASFNSNFVVTCSPANSTLVTIALQYIHQIHSSFLTLYLHVSLSLPTSGIRADPYRLQRYIADLRSQGRKDKKIFFLNISCPTKTYFIFGRILPDGHLEIRLTPLYDLKPFIQAPDLPIVLVSRAVVTCYAVCYLV